MQIPIEMVGFRPLKCAEHLMNTCGYSARILVQTWGENTTSQWGQFMLKKKKCDLRVHICLGPLCVIVNMVHVYIFMTVV